MENGFLDMTALRSVLTSHTGVAVRLYEVLDSTNTEAKRRAETDGEAPVLYLAHAQTAGRGRLGRTFHSPGTGIYMTLAYTTEQTLSEAVSVTGDAAVAAAEAIETLTGKSPAIKWVNDLYLGGGKLAGILTEAVPLPDGRARILVGIGINLATKDFPDDLRAPAVSLFSSAEADGLTPAFLGTLAGEITRRLLDALEDRPARADRLAAYRRRLLSVGETVICTRGDERFTGTVLGVDDGYSLLVDVAGETRTLSSGEISIRPAP